MLRFFSSSTSMANSRKAIAECIESALEGEHDLHCDLLIIYAAMGHDFNEILAGATQLCPKAEIVGCSCAGVIGMNGADETMKAVAVMAVKCSEGEFVVASKDDIVGCNSYEVASELAGDLKSKNPYINMIHVSASGTDIAADKAIAGIESVFGTDVPIFGAISSDNMRGLSSYQFAGNKVFQRGVVIVGLSDPTLEVVSQATHGFIPIGMPFAVTRSEANRIYELDGQPAWKVITDNLGLPETAQLVDTIPIGAVAEELSEELHREYRNTHILRVIVKKEQDGSVYVPVDCPQGTRLWLTRRDEERIFQGLDEMMERIVRRSAGRTPVAVFHADCGARGRLLFNRVLKDEIVNRMQFPLLKGNIVPWLGMYGFGEFAMLAGRNTFHNYSTALHVILRRQDSA
jgi:hypothetical protein